MAASGHFVVTIELPTDSAEWLCAPRPDDGIAREKSKLTATVHQGLLFINYTDLLGKADYRGKEANFTSAASRNLA